MWATTIPFALGNANIFSAASAPCYVNCEVSIKYVNLTIAIENIDFLVFKYAIFSSTFHPKDGTLSDQPENSFPYVEQQID